jgi:hypothetical protein
MQLDKKLRRRIIKVKQGEIEYKFNHRMVELYREINLLGKNSLEYKKLGKSRKKAKKGKVKVR